MVKKLIRFPYGDISYFDSIRSYYIASALEDALKDIMEKENISEEEAKQQIVTGGYKIYLCVDSNIQSNLEKVYSDNDNFINGMESAAIVIDNKTGEVRAVVGGRNLNNEAITFGEFNKANKIANLNIATDVLVTPGYMFGNISVYACGLSNGIFTLDSIYNYDESKNGYIPKDYDMSTLRNVSIKRAIQSELNPITVLAFNDIGVDKCIKFLESVGINTITEKDKNVPSLALGGFKGVKLIEVSSAYRTILVDGEYKEPILYSKILDKKGNIYIKKNQENRNVMDKSVCDNLKLCYSDGEEEYLIQSVFDNNRVSWCNINNGEYTCTSTCYMDNIDMEVNGNFATKLLSDFFK